MDKQSRWKQVEAKNATSAALTTQITNLEKKISAGGMTSSAQTVSKSATSCPGSTFTMED